MEPVLRCPSCGNTLQAVDAPSITCPFCRTSVPIPATFRPAVIMQPPPNPYAQPPNPYAQPPNPYGARPPSPFGQSPSPYYAPNRVVVLNTGGGRTVGIVVAVIFLFVFGGIGAMSFLIRSAVSSAVGGSATKGADGQTSLLSFGGKGTGAGFFDDARSIAVDPDGNIFVADYSDGRVQKFDSSGKFTKLIQLDTDDSGNVYVPSIAADHKGNLWVLASNKLLKFRAKDGKLLSTIIGGDKEKTAYYQSVAVDSSDNVWCEGESDDLYKLDGDGKVLKSWDKLVHTANKKDPVMSLRLAVDGEGTIVIGSEMSGTIYVFDNKGSFQNRFTVKDGDTPATDLGAIAVSGKGQIYATQFVSVSVFDSSGTTVSNMKLSDSTGYIYGMTFDASDNLYVVSDNTVHKYKAN